MDDRLSKPYNPNETEKRIYKKWEDSGYFNPDKCIADGITSPDAEPFSIVLPPPNVTGILHMGSALMVVIEDILIRHARMSGKRTLWIPGTDSAAIATQSKVEKEIQKKEKKNRYDLGREELLRRIDSFVEENKSTILNQLRGAGASLDWSRYAYTMDDKRCRAVTEAFIRMYNTGLIYRGNRIVNWDPKGQTVISDDEIVYEERDSVLYTFRYWKDFPIAISTTRPETKVGDTAVAVHPDDPRYQSFVGKEFSGEFAGAKLTIRVIADKSVEKDFGTGALGVTPAHSQIDWEIADRHDLPRPQVINERATMTDGAGELVQGLKVAEAREKIVAWLKENNLLDKEEKIKQNVSTAERTGGVVEPLPKLQWFVDVDKPFNLPHSEIPGIESGSQTTLKKIMRRAVESGAVKILPERFETTYYHWIDNLRPWCISRQIWFGHRIPVWYRSTSLTTSPEIFCGLNAPTGEGLAASAEAGWQQDPDVLDTWFSSALWTFSTLGWPFDYAQGKPVPGSDLAIYHPTAVLETGYDILFFWVARMILMSGFILGEVPFRTVYLHGLVRDQQGRKISKSLGNNIDPIEMGGRYGTDAVRMSLVIGTSPGADSKMWEDKIKAYKHFSNKLWNIARFVLSNIDQPNISGAELTDSDKKILDGLKQIVNSVSKDLEDYKFHLAAENLYHYIWHEFADKIIEESKPLLQSENVATKNSRQKLLLDILATCLKLLHPFMPFVTEEIWNIMPKENGESKILMIEKWPQ